MEKTQCVGICKTGKQCKIMVVIGVERKSEYCARHLVQFDVKFEASKRVQCLGTTKKGKQCKKKGMTKNGVYSCSHHADVKMDEKVSEDAVSEGSDYVPDVDSVNEDAVSEGSDYVPDVDSVSEDAVSEDDDLMDVETNTCGTCGSHNVLTAKDTNAVDEEPRLYLICTTCQHSWVKEVDAEETTVNTEDTETKEKTKVKKTKENTSMRCHGTTKDGKRCRHKKKMEGVYYCRSHKLMETTNLIVRCDHIKHNGHRCRKVMKPTDKKETNYICHIHSKSV